MISPDSLLSGLIERASALGIKPTNDRLVASIASQRLLWFSGDRLLRTLVMSTGRNPPSCREGSEGTPTGLHRAADRIGRDQPAGMVFTSRLPQGRCWPEFPSKEQAGNLITTRIIRLRGLEPGHNAGPGVDTYDRYVYIHGTNHPDRLGRPQSAGCLLLGDDDLIELFDRLEDGALVWITPD